MVVVKVAAGARGAAAGGMTSEGVGEVAGTGTGTGIIATVAEVVVVRVPAAEAAILAPSLTYIRVTCRSSLTRGTAAARMRGLGSVSWTRCLHPGWREADRAARMRGRGLELWVWIGVLLRTRQVHRARQEGRWIMPEVLLPMQAWMIRALWVASESKNQRACRPRGRERGRTSRWTTCWRSMKKGVGTMRINGCRGFQQRAARSV